MRYLTLFFSLFVDIFQNRALLWELTKKDFKTRYLGSHLGILWAFIQPTITVFIFWFVFEVGFKSRPVDNFPFILWLVAGMFPWFFISESISSSTTSIIENSYLVKNIVFRVSLLPIIKIISAFIIHMFFLGMLVIMMALYGYMPSVYNLQIVYYLFATSCLLLGISWITATLTIFLKDVGQIIGMILQFAFWGTPIFWSAGSIPAKYLSILKLNPAYYIIEGYRNSFIYHRWFWQDVNLTIYYWVVTSLVLVGGAIVFKKLRPHFADVL